jgi:hypothetical protein
VSGDVLNASTIGIVTGNVFVETITIKPRSIAVFCRPTSFGPQENGVKDLSLLHFGETELPEKSVTIPELKGSGNKKIEFDSEVYECLIVSGSAEWVRMVLDHMDYGVTLLHGFCKNKGGRGGDIRHSGQE